MCAGLFTVTCPECGNELHVDELGMGTCSKCDHTYLQRFGCLIPLEISIEVVTSGVVTSTVATTDRSDDSDGSDDAVNSDGSPQEESLSMGGALT